MCEWSNKGTTYSVYYKKMKSEYTELRDKLVEEVDKAKEENVNLRKELLSYRNSYKLHYGINLTELEEFNKDAYSSGKLYKIAKGAMLKHADSYEKMYELNTFLKYATNQKDIAEKTAKIEHYNKCLALTSHQYRDLIYAFYNKVQEKLILEGYGYPLEGRVGWLCINRVKINNKPITDYAATRKKKEELIAKGLRPYDQKEHEWAKQHGLPYDGVRYRVTKTEDYAYEIALVGCKLENRVDCRLYNINYVDKKIKRKSFDELAAEYKDDIEGAARLSMDLAHKLAVCLKIDSNLSNKYKRTDNEIPYKHRTYRTAEIGGED